MFVCSPTWPTCAAPLRLPPRFSALLSSTPTGRSAASAASRTGESPRSTSPTLRARSPSPSTTAAGWPATTATPEQHPTDGSFPPHTIHGFVWDHGRVTTLDVPGSLATYAFRMNDRGQITGIYQRDPTRLRLRARPLPEIHPSAPVESTAPGSAQITLMCLSAALDRCSVSTDSSRSAAGRSTTESIGRSRPPLGWEALCTRDRRCLVRGRQDAVAEA
jgi:hypothetical protein